MQAKTDAISNNLNSKVKCNLINFVNLKQNCSQNMYLELLQITPKQTSLGINQTLRIYIHYTHKSVAVKKKLQSEYVTRTFTSNPKTNITCYKPNLFYVFYEYISTTPKSPWL